MLLLTATPLQNNVLELFNIITLLKPGLLGTQKEFKNNFVIKAGSNKIKNEEKLHTLLSEVMIRNNRSNVDIEIVSRNAEIINITLSDEEQLFYTEISNYVKDYYPFGTDGVSKKANYLDLNTCINNSNRFLNEDIKNKYQKLKKNIELKISDEISRIEKYPNLLINQI